MNAPKCKLCGERHYGICPSTFEKVRNLDIAPLHKAALAEGAKVQSAKPSKGGPATIDLGYGPKKMTYVPQTGERILIVDDGSPPPKPKFDRTAYQRDYMRKRRAADKAKKE